MKRDLEPTREEVKQWRGDSKLLNLLLHRLITQDQAFHARVRAVLDSDAPPPVTVEELKQLLWDIVG